MVKICLWLASSSPMNRSSSGDTKTGSFLCRPFPPCGALFMLYAGTVQLLGPYGLYGAANKTFIHCNHPKSECSTLGYV